MIRGVIRDVRASSVIEFALCLPLMVTMIYGSAEMTHFVHTRALFYEATNALSEIVAEQAHVTSGSSGTLNDFCTGASYIVANYPNGNLAVSIASVTRYSTGIVRDWEYDSACPTAGANIGQANAIALATPLVPNVGDGVIIVQSSFSYDPYLHGPYIIEFTPTRFQLTKYSRPRFGGNATTPTPIVCTIAGAAGKPCPTLP